MSSILNLPLHFDFTADPRGYDWQVVMVNDDDPSSIMCQVNVNGIYTDFEYSLKRELQDRMWESMKNEWKRCRAEEMKEYPYYKENFDFGEIDDLLEIEGDCGEGSLTELIHERLDEYFDNTFDLSEWVGEHIAGSDYKDDLNQAEGDLHEWLIEALEYHADEEEIFQHFIDENLDGEIWSACLHEITIWIDKTYKPKTIDELTEENKTLKEENKTLKEEIETLKEAVQKEHDGRMCDNDEDHAVWRVLKQEIETLKQEIETLKEKNNTLKEENKTLKEKNKTLTNARRLLVEQIKTLEQGMEAEARRQKVVRKVVRKVVQTNPMVRR